LQQQPSWQGQGILVDRRGSRGVVLIPALDLEVTLTVPPAIALNGALNLQFQGFNLPLLDAYFQLR
jgi:hypothetical protein